MEGTYKQFDREVFEAEDRRARDAVIAALAEEGLYARDNDDKYGPDLMLYHGYRHIGYIEVEVKRAWRPPTSSVGLSDEPAFPFPTVQVPERKLKFAGNNRTRKTCDFWVLRSDLSFGLIITDKVLRTSPLVEVPNSMVASGELFITVPVADCTIRKL
jgi:hypothetical protein